MTLRNILLRSTDLLISPVVYLAGDLLKNVRRIGLASMPACKHALLAAGVLPIRNHYYEPRFDFRGVDFSHPRTLPAVDWNLPSQTKLLNALTQYRDEFPTMDGLTNNSNFMAGDAEFWFAIIRHFKPKRIIEIGSGYSTKIARLALAMNQREGNSASHVCIEPYEMPWLEATGATVLRQQVETVDIASFSQLERNDILFIDSSHIIRPRGDVLIEVLEILPMLKPGVIVHFHDIFSPLDYPKRWLVDEIYLWNEQYLLEAFLSNNAYWEILASLNLLHHSMYEELSRVCRLLTSQRNPGSFYIRKLS